MRSDRLRRVSTQPQPHWNILLERFPAGRDCLTTFVAFESAEILAGVKPANLINLVDRPHHCGRNFYRLWKECGGEVMLQSGLSSRILVDRGPSLLLLVFDEKQLRGLLQRPAVQAMLRRAGYLALDDLDDVLTELGCRCSAGDGFPHEIGIFLGYPLKDVAAFLGWIAIPLTMQGPWKIYGRADNSLQLAEEHRRCRVRMAQRLNRCCRPEECLLLPGKQRVVRCK